MPNTRRILLSLGALTVLVVGAFVVVTVEGASAAVITILILLMILIGPLVWQRTMGQTIAARLQASEERLSCTTQEGDAGIWDWNIETGEVNYNSRWQTMLGYEPGEIQPTLDFWKEKILHPDDKPVVTQAMEAHARGDTKLYEATYRARAKSGDWIWILARGEVVERAEDGSPLRIVITHVDVSERKRIEEQLHQSEERLKLVIEATNDGVWDHCSTTGETYYNSRWFTMLGYEPGAFDGSSGFFESQIVHPEDLPRFEQGWTDHIEGRTPHYETELRARAKTGEWIWILARGKIVSRDENNAPLRVVGTHVDISERKRIEEQLSESEERLKFAIEGSNDGVWDCQVDTGQTYRNSRWYTMLGYEPGELEGLSWSEETQMAHPEDRPRFEQVWTDHMEGRTPSYEMELRVRTKSGEWLWILSRGKIVSRDENNAPLRVVGTHVDISERKRMEAELEKARQRMADELDVGREIQMGMLPLIFPAFPQRHEFSVFASLNPAREVGGDFYDFFFIDDDHFCFCVGDVSGKGVPAALFMAVTHALIESRATDDQSPASILAHVNGDISRHNEASMFVSVFLAILDLRTGQFSYANAGHNPPYIKRRDGTLDRLDQFHGPVIGAVEDLSYQEGSGCLSLGDMFFLFTDGVTEAMNRQKQLYGEERLVDLLSSRDHKSAESLTLAVVDDVQDFEAGADQADDVTILSLQYFGAPEYVRQVVTLEIDVQNRLAEIDRVNRKFNAFAEAHSIPTRAARSINLVFDELLNNIVSYAFEDEESHVIRIRIELAGHRLAVTIRDDGIPFNPFARDRPDTSLSIEEREIGGLGVHLVSNVMDEVSYSRPASDNVVTLVKYLEPKD